MAIPDDYGTARGLTPQAEATKLVSIGPNPDGQDVVLAPAAAEAWRRMRAAAGKEGVTLLPLSGFRSVERQAAIIREKLAAGEAIGAILRFVAAPGYSEHHTGLALDIGAPNEPPLTAEFGATPAFRWLDRRAGEFGFKLSYPVGNPHGFAYEPWHWRWHSLI